MTASLQPRVAAALLLVLTAIVILISTAKSQEEGACLYETGTARELCGKYDVGPVSNACCTFLRDLINDSETGNSDDLADQCDCVGVVGVSLAGENDTKLEILNKECGVNITLDPLSCEAKGSYFKNDTSTEEDCNYVDSVFKSCIEEGAMSKECCTALRDFNVAVNGNSNSNNTSSYGPCYCLDLILNDVTPASRREDFTKECGVNLDTLCKT